MKSSRPKKCRVCGEKYRPQNSLQTACSPECAIKKVRNERVAAQFAPYRAKRGKVVHNKAWHLKTAQAAFNAYIRERDKALPCVSCGKWHQGQYHAGHFRPVGSQPAVRFDERNCHRQCSVCNNHRSGNLNAYRPELIRRVGSDVVDWLERDHPPRKFEIEELKTLTALYRQKLKDMQSK